jgi:calcium-dependent protein kinase
VPVENQRDGRSSSGVEIGATASAAAVAVTNTVADAAADAIDTYDAEYVPHQDSQSSGLFADLGLEPKKQFAIVSNSTFDTKYEVLPSTVLGKGISGAVRLAKVRSSGVEVALKTLTTTDLSPSRLELVLAEVRNQLSLNHPNICRLLEVYEEPSRVILVLERMRGPDLLSYWCRKDSYRENEAAACLRQICSAVGYMHSKGVCHRDLKCENFCLEEDALGARVKLIDFGLSEAFTSLPMTRACGSLHYVAPEIFLQKYDSKCDIWSLGVVAYVLLTGRMPFDGKSDRETAKLIRSATFKALPVEVSTHAHDFVATCLRTQPQDRPNAADLLLHPWLANTDQQSATNTPLDSVFLQNLRALARGSVLQRAVISAVAPVATVEDVARWENQFEALDAGGRGLISASTLAQRLAELPAVSTEEAEVLSATLAELGDGDGGLVSYSAFLSACLCTRMALSDEQVAEDLFNRLDEDADGRITIRELEVAFGDVDVEALSDLELEIVGSDGSGKGFTLDGFKALLQGPLLGGAGRRALQGLLGVCRDLPLNTRFGKHRVRLNTGDDFAAARAENIAWRHWAADPASAAAMASSLAVEKDRSESPRQPQPPSSLKAKALQQEFQSVGSPERHEAWAVATREAKTGDWEAARRENMTWRLEAKTVADGARKQGMDVSLPMAH